MTEQNPFTDKGYRISKHRESNSTRKSSKHLILCSQGARDRDIKAARLQPPDNAHRMLQKEGEVKVHRFQTHITLFQDMY